MESTLASLAPRTAYSRIWRNVKAFARMRPWHTFWGVVSLAIVIVSFGGYLVLPIDAFSQDYDNLTSPPSAQYWTGTDLLGRDLTSRLVYGGAVSLFIAGSALLLGTIIGGTWGLVSGYLGGKTDLISERFIEILLSLPGLIFAYLMILVFGDGYLQLILALAITRIGSVERVVRSVALSVKRDHVCGSRQKHRGFSDEDYLEACIPPVRSCHNSIDDDEHRGNYHHGSLPQLSGVGDWPSNSNMGQNAG